MTDGLCKFGAAGRRPPVETFQKVLSLYKWMKLCGVSIKFWFVLKRSFPRTIRPCFAPVAYKLSLAAGGWRLAADVP